MRRYLNIECLISVDCMILIPCPMARVTSLHMKMLDSLLGNVGVIFHCSLFL